MDRAKVLKGFLFIATISIVIGCGSASNNDQGVAFTFLGYSAPDDGECSTTPNLSGGVIPLGVTDEALGDSGQFIAGVVVRNNLTAAEGSGANNPNLQVIRTEFATFDYFIPGASIQPPSTTVAYGGIVAAKGGLLCGQIPIVPPEITAWMSFNRVNLPEPPFSLNIAGRVTGVTSSGDVIETNSLNIGLTVTSDNVIPPAGESEDTTDDTGGVSSESFEEDLPLDDGPVSGEGI